MACAAVGQVVTARLPWGEWPALVVDVVPGRPGWVYVVPFTWAGAQVPIMLAPIESAGDGIGWHGPGLLSIGMGPSK